MGGSKRGRLLPVYADLGLDPDPTAMAESADWLHEYTGSCSKRGCPGVMAPANCSTHCCPLGCRWRW